jgi:hypothetical protein
MSDLEKLEREGSARQTLREAYRQDVETHARLLFQSIRSGSFEWRGGFTAPFFLDIRRHPRVSVPELAHETICYSENRGAIEQDYLHPEDAENSLPPGYDYDSAVGDDVPALPAWESIAFYAFRRDVEEAITRMLGGRSPEEELLDI